ncbi:MULTISPECIES: hypothetical protein [Streptomyces]|uniref:hypothetical protein n=1 Tax=Streptomyces TaxID=1883 RepID=UPI00017E857E|nr:MULTISPECIES: hypothetical protein [Streptomyces]EDX20295.1 hypothetical protein SSAG_00086 [Streptomyces sp. Mg1]WSS03445.1 hypothetical protein OG224_01135 [Streptomyces goshikiensis]
MRFGVYSVTRKGFDEYQKNFMWSGRGDEVNISASAGGFVVANFNSPHAVAHGGTGNRGDRHDVSHRQLIDALRTDARSAEPAEAVRAQEYAEDLASAVEAQDSDRMERVLARIDALLSTAAAGFALTMALLFPSACPPRARAAPFARASSAAGRTGRRPPGKRPQARSGGRATRRRAYG